MRMHQEFKHCSCGENLFEITPIYNFKQTEDNDNDISLEELERVYKNKQIYKYKLTCISCKKVKFL